MSFEQNKTYRDRHWLLTEQSAAELQDLSDGAIVVDRAGRIIFANAVAVAMHGRLALGVQPDEYSAMHGLFTEDGHPYPSADLPLARAAVNSEIVTGARWRIRRPDGSMITAEGDARPIFKENGDQNGAVLIFRQAS